MPGHQTRGGECAAQLSARSCLQHPWPTQTLAPSPSTAPCLRPQRLLTPSTAPLDSTPPSAMKRIKDLAKVLLSVYYLVLIVLTIPLAFDVGGVSCGLSFSLTLLVLYFLLTTGRLLSRRHGLLRWLSLVYYLQHLFIPSILMFHLLYSQKSRAGGASAASSAGALDSGIEPLRAFFVAVWKYFLTHLTLVFTISEGFCTLLLIQLVSQTMQWLTIYKSDSWLFVSLIGSGATITGALYFLYRIFINPFTLELGNALLLGSFLTLTVGLGLYGIVSGKGSMIESSLLFAYIVRCIYETFPILSQDATDTITNLFTQTTMNIRNEIIKYPNPVLEKISLVIPILAANIPHLFTTIWIYFISAIHKLTLPLLINLAYRIGVFYAATKIIPSIYHGLPYLPPRTPQARLRQVSSSSLPSLERPDRLQTREPKFPAKDAAGPAQAPPSAAIRLIYAYSPCIIIAVYTHLMLLYKGELGSELVLWGWWPGAAESNVVIVHPWQFWNWINMATTLFLYMAELAGNATTSSSALSLRWKLD